MCLSLCIHRIIVLLFAKASVPTGEYAAHGPPCSLLAEHSASQWSCLQPLSALPSHSVRWHLSPPTKPHLLHQTLEALCPPAPSNPRLLSARASLHITFQGNHLHNHHSQGRAICCQDIIFFFSILPQKIVK